MGRAASRHNSAHTAGRVPGRPCRRPCLGPGMYQCTCDAHGRPVRPIRWYMYSL